MFENYVNVIFSDILPHNIKTFYAYAQREDFSFWHGFYSCSICKVVTRLTSDTNDFVNDEGHARKKPLLGGYSRKAQLLNILISWCLLLACSLKNKTLFSLFLHDTLSCVFSRGIINVASFWRHSILLSSEFEYLGVLTSKTLVHFTLEKGNELVRYHQGEGLGYHSQFLLQAASVQTELNAFHPTENKIKHRLSNLTASLQWRLARSISIGHPVTYSHPHLSGKKKNRRGTPVHRPFVRHHLWFSLQRVGKAWEQKWGRGREDESPSPRLRPITWKNLDIACFRETPVSKAILAANTKRLWLKWIL